MRDDEEIGGYFGLWLPEGDTIYEQAISFNSARSAIRAVLQSCAKNVIYVPFYVCDSVIKAASDAGYVVILYRINSNFMPLDVPTKLDAQTLLLYVNYFGLCDRQVSKVLKLYHADQVIIDNSHALYSEPSEALATIYSPRKFVGLPDGGLACLAQGLQLDKSYPQDTASLSRMNYLLIRYGYDARAGYESFNLARESLSDNTPKAMSALTKKLMRSIPWQQVRQSRQTNYLAMQSYFADINLLKFDAVAGTAPLCFPLRVANRNLTKVKQWLADNSIFSPTYWPDVVSRAVSGSVELQLVEQTLYLPLDQRMTSEHVARVCRKVTLALVSCD